MKKFTLEEIQKKVIGQALKLSMPVDRAQVADDRTVDLAVTSDKPIQHWFGNLVLNHDPAAIRLDRVSTGAPLLLEHDRRIKIGGLSNWNTDGHVLRATAKFSRRPEAQAELDDLSDGIPRQVSGGFLIHEIHFVKQSETDGDTYQSDDWEPLEASLVSIPADTSVGIGRALKEARDDKTECEMDDEESQDAEDECPECDGEGCPECEDDDEEETQSSDRAATAADSETRAQDSTPRVEITLERTNSLMNKEELLKLGEMFGMRALAEQYILDNSDPTEAGLKALIREERAKTQVETVKPVPRVDMQERDLRNYSLARAIKLAAGIDVDKCGFENEISQEIERNMQRQGIESRGGVFVPTGHPRELLQRSGLDTATSNKGTESVFTEYGGFVEYLYNRAKVLSLGATTLTGLQGNVKFLKQTGLVTAGWVAENPGSDASDSELSTDSFTLSPKSLLATTLFSRQLLNQSVVNIETVVKNDLALAMALAVDKAAIHGTGSSNQPKGIYQISSVGAKAFGGVMTKALLTDMKSTISGANADIGDYGFITTPDAIGVGEKTLEFSSAGANPLYKDGKLIGIRCEGTNQCSKVMNSSAATGGSSHALVLGVWNQFLWAEWGAMELITDPYAKKKQAMIEVTAFLMADFNVRHPEAFCKATGHTIT